MTEAPLFRTVRAPTPPEYTSCDRLTVSLTSGLQVLSFESDPHVHEAFRIDVPHGRRRRPRSAQTATGLQRARYQEDVLVGEVHVVLPFARSWRAPLPPASFEELLEVVRRGRVDQLQALPDHVLVSVQHREVYLRWRGEVVHGEKLTHEADHRSVQSAPHRR